VLAVYVVISSVFGLCAHRVTDTHESAWGILIGIIAKIGMPLPAAGKLRVAARLNSRALRADAMEASTCGYLSMVLMAGLASCGCGCEVPHDDDKKKRDFSVQTLSCVLLALLACVVSSASIRAGIRRQRGEYVKTGKPISTAH